MTEKELDELYLEGLEAEEEGDFDKAFNLFMRGAVQGDDKAMNFVGLLYDRGEGAPKDKTKALEWLKKAHRVKKTSNFCHNIALTYAQIGNRRQAVHWWRKAIALGDGGSALFLAKFLMMSDEVVMLLEEAASHEAPLTISENDKEEAAYLLEITAHLRRD